MPAPCHRTTNSTNALVFRFEVESADSRIVRDLVTATGKFYEEEVDIAVELIEERLNRGLASGYEFIFVHQALDMSRSDQGSSLAPSTEPPAMGLHPISPNSTGSQLMDARTKNSNSKDSALPDSHSMGPPSTSHSEASRLMDSISTGSHPNGSNRPGEIGNVEATDATSAKSALADAKDAASSQGIVEVVGFACYGKIPCTRQAYDLYWIAVHPAYQGRGLGRQLLSAVEAAIRAAGGTQLYADTSGRADYEATREYYLATGFEQAACLTDFYAPDDDKIIFRKLV